MHSNRTVRQLVLFLLLIGAMSSPLPLMAAEPPPAREVLLHQSRRCRHILKTSIVKFYLPACMDRANHGYFESLRNGKFAPSGEKFLTMQGRQLWFFSTLAREATEEAAMGAANVGFWFLRDRLRDDRHGGYHSKVSDSGTPVDPHKHVYLNSFALYGLAGYHRALQEERRGLRLSAVMPVTAAAREMDALEAAQELFGTLEEKAYDRKHGGYVEYFTREWLPVTDPRAPCYVGTAGTKTYNTHLHLLEAFTELYRVWPNDLVRKRLNGLLVINMSTVHHPDFNCNIDGWHPDWRMIDTPRNLRASYGHDVECVWLVLDAGRALGLSPHLLRGWAEALCGYSLKYGYDRQHGGFYYTGPLGKPADDTKKEWWVQAEALVSMLEMYRLTGKREYYDAFSQTLDFVEKHQVAKEGGWWASRKADGTPLNNERSSPWQGAYHSGRSMILCAKLLEELADRPAPHK